LKKLGTDADFDTDSDTERNNPQYPMNQNFKHGLRINAERLHLSYSKFDHLILFRISGFDILICIHSVFGMPKR